MKNEIVKIEEVKREVKNEKLKGDKGSEAKSEE